MWLFSIIFLYRAATKHLQFYVDFFFLLPFVLFSVSVSWEHRISKCIYLHTHSIHIVIILVLFWPWPSADWILFNTLCCVCFDCFHFSLCTVYILFHSSLNCKHFSLHSICKIVYPVVFFFFIYFLFIFSYVASYLFH